ncbi:MAG: VirB4 family type IV secretion system protein [Burkholderiales bacterium]
MRSFAELLPWFHEAGPGLVLNLDGSFLAGYEYEGPQLEGTNESVHEACIESMEIAMRAFDDRNVIWTFLDKRKTVYTQASTIANPVARYVDDIWRQHVDGGNLSKIRCLFFVSFQPFTGQGGFFEEVSTRARQDELPFTRAFWNVMKQRLQRKEHIQRLEGRLEVAIDAFESQLTSFVTTLGSKLNIHRLDSDALRVELANRANLASPREQVVVPPNGLYFLNTLLPVDSVMREAGGVLRFEGAVGSRYVSMHSLKGYPGFASNEVVESLLDVPSEFTLVQMYRPMEQERAKAFIADQHQHYESNVKSVFVQAVEKFTGETSTKVNLGMQALADDAQEALISATRDNVGFGHHSMALQVITSTREEQDAATQPIYAVLQNAGYGLVRENVNVGSALSITLPGAADAVLRSSLVSTSNLADMTVLRSVSAGPAVNAHLTEQRGIPSEALSLFPSVSDVPEFFDFHVGDVGHFFVVGPIGAGKSTIVNFLMMQWQRYAPCKVIALDKDMSNYITISALGGEYVNIKPDTPGSARMSPIRWLRRREDYVRLRNWLDLALTAFDAVPLSVTDIKVLDRSMEVLASQSGTKSLSALHAIVQGQDKNLGNRFLPWIKGGRYGSLFDHEEDDLVLSDICGIEMGELLADQNLAPAVLGYLFEVVDESVDSTRPSLIYLEEAWYLLSNPIFAARFEGWIKTMRKRNACVGIATQSLADIRKTPISSTLNDNIKTRIFLPNLQAFDSIDIYRDMLGLRDDEVDVIRSAVEKRQYYLVRKERRRLVDVRLPKEVLALTRSDPKAKALFNHHRQGGGERWLADYLEQINAT